MKTSASLSRKASEAGVLKKVGQGERNSARCIGPAGARAGRTQQVVCNALHELEERLGRWLESRDLLNSDILPLTKGIPGADASVQRSSITLVARKLQEAG